MNKNYQTKQLTLKTKIRILRDAKKICFSWWVDILDCSKSCARQRIEMKFSAAVALFNDSSHFSIIHRNNDLENYLEVGYRNMDRDFDYFQEGQP